MKKTFNIWILFVSIFIILPVFDAKAGWIDIPTVFNNLFVEEGPDGTLGTADDILCISSGYADGTYEGLGGEDLTANVSMLSKVWPIAPNQWRYHWKITNTGTGPFVDYVDTGNGPNFLQDPPLAAQETEVDTLVGGRPKIGTGEGDGTPKWNLRQCDMILPLSLNPQLYCFSEMVYLG